MCIQCVDSSGQVRYAGDSSTTTGETQIPAKQWDFNSGTLRNPATVIDTTSSSPIIGRTGPADLCVQNALASTMSTEPKPNVSHYVEPIYAQIHKNSRTCSPSAFPVSYSVAWSLCEMTMVFWLACFCMFVSFRWIV